MVKPSGCFVCLNALLRPQTSPLLLPHTELQIWDLVLFLNSSNRGGKKTHLLLLVKPFDLRLLRGPVWRTSAADWRRTLRCQSTRNRWIHTCNIREPNYRHCQRRQGGRNVHCGPSSPVTVGDDLVHTVHDLRNVLADPGEDFWRENLNSTQNISNYRGKQSAHRPHLHSRSRPPCLCGNPPPRIWAD